MKIEISRNEIDQDMLNLVSRNKNTTILWAVVHEDFLSDELKAGLKADSPLELLLVNPRGNCWFFNA